jgi:hypothetical protein
VAFLAKSEMAHRQDAGFGSRAGRSRILRSLPIRLHMFQTNHSGITSIGAKFQLTTTVMGMTACEVQQQILAPLGLRKESLSVSRKKISSGLVHEVNHLLYGAHGYLERFSNTSFTTGSAEKAFGQPA